MLLSDLMELRSFLEIDPDDHSEDKKLAFLLGYASEWIGESINRPGLFYKSRTEYYNGSGTQKLLLKSRPVYTTPTIACIIDGNGFFGQTSGAFQSPNSPLVYGTDFVAQIDQDDGTSRCGILVRINSYWERPYVRQRGLLSPFPGSSYGSIKVTYTGGYTIDSLPGVFRQAANMLVGRLRAVLPLGVETTSESYEERSLSVVTAEKAKLMALVRPLVFAYTNWNFGGRT